MSSRLAIVLIAACAPDAAYPHAAPCPDLPARRGLVPDPGRIAALVAGGDRTCALDEGGVAHCWGAATTCDQPDAAPLAALAIAGRTTCELGRDGSLRCRGDEMIAGDRLAGDARATKIALGGNHACAIVDGGAVRCWGYNERGMLGTGDHRPRAMATAEDLVVGKPAVRIAIGGAHTCVVTDDAHVRCWGDAVLGYGTREVIGDDEFPAAAGDVPVGAPVVDVVAGVKHTCALLDGGRVRCWGVGDAGELGYGYINTIGDDEPASAAGDVPIGGAVTALAAGAYHTCALLDTASVRCWGHDSDGQLGYATHHGRDYNSIGDNEPASDAGDVPLGGRAVAIAAGNYHTCALLDTGALRCWGRAEQGQLGYPIPPGAPWGTANVGDDETPAQQGDIPFARMHP